jgi:hypothetical protein
MRELLSGETTNVVPGDFEYSRAMEAIRSSRFGILMDPPLSVKVLNGISHFATRKLLDCLF